LIELSTVDYQTSALADDSMGQVSYLSRPPRPQSEKFVLYIPFLPILVTGLRNTLD
jgi:hypothetical protein